MKKSLTVPDARVWLIQAVRDHAMAHYDEGGWDVIVESWSMCEIYNVVKRHRTAKGAIAKIAGIVEIYAEQQADARNSAF